MIQLGVVGLGTIFTKQKVALSMLKDEFKLIAVCDINREKADISYDDLCGEHEEKPKFFESVDSFLQNSKVDAVLIATPPKTHYVLAKSVLLADKNVLLEKPAVLSMEELHDLYHTADEHHVILHIAYHASFAGDLMWFLTNRNNLKETYHLGNISEIECGFYDPYMIQEKIIPNKINLCGSLIDSGVNELSVCDKLVDLERAILVGKKVEQLDGTVYSSSSIYEGRDGCRIKLKTAWNLDKNEKKSLLSFQGTDKKLLLDHSGQQVILLEDKEYKILFKNNSTERLVRHYLGVFQDFTEAYRKHEDNRAGTIRIHLRLFEEMLKSISKQ